MSKKIFIVSSTPRKNGNSDILAEEFARGAREAGHSVEKICLREIELKFCTGCMYCHTRGTCVIKDGVETLLPRIADSDVLVFATPVYYYEMSGQLKTFLDRMNPLYGRDNRFREVYLLASAADTGDKRHGRRGEGRSGMDRLLRRCGPQRSRARHGGGKGRRHPCNKCRESGV